MTSDGFYETANRAAIPRLVELSEQVGRFSAPRLRISRVAQLDAELLDRELHHILQEPVTRALHDLRHPSRPSLEAELLAVLQFIVLRLSLHQTGASYGARLQNLKYRDERSYDGPQHSSPIVYAPTPLQLNAYTALSILPAYLHSRIRDYMLSNGWSDYPVPRSTVNLFLTKPTSTRDADRRRREQKRWIWDFISRAEQLWSIARLVNFLVFLYDGKYRTLVDRLLRMRLTYAKRAVTRNVSFEFLNRQLVWEAFTEFLLFLMPLINLRKLRLRASRLLTRSSTAQSLLAALPRPLRHALRLPTPSSLKGKGKSSKEPTLGPYHNLPPHVCAICFASSLAPPTHVPPAQADPTDPGVSTGLLAQRLAASSTSDNTIGGGGHHNEAKIPYQVGCCGARYCYYCLTGRLVSWEEDRQGVDGGWQCLRCNGEVVEAWRWKGDVVEDPSSGESEGEVTDVEEADTSGSS